MALCCTRALYCYVRSKVNVRVAALNSPTYSLLMWQRRRLSNELDKVDSATQQKHTGLKLTDRCVKVSIHLSIS